MRDFKAGRRSFDYHGKAEARQQIDATHGHPEYHRQLCRDWIDSQRVVLPDRAVGRRLLLPGIISFGI
ncbi:hypothetical protein [Caballeronia sp. Lep1P3]|uniref:hypothetical protein n=1 Tax=Caballeronia sp. Lep1P3 TaxID=2878150 RepID=UPI001FD092FB|nr:hypothetical protein [Caballeronia sp. Lep1P3]